MGRSRTVIEEPLTQEEQSKNFLSLVNRGTWIAFLVSAVYQLVFFPELENIAVIIFCAVGWFAYTKLFLYSTLWRSHMFSSLLIFGFATTGLLLPLVFTTMEGKPVVYNLDYPELVFLHALATLAVLIVAHLLYRFLYHRAPQRPYSIMEKVGFFTAPNDLQLWMMGAIGLASMYYIFFMVPDVGRSVTGTPIDKLIQSMMSFAYAPYLILCGELYGRKEKSLGSNVFQLIAFTLVLFALSIGRNSTGAFMFGFTGLAFAFLVGLFMGVFKTKIFTFKNFVLAGIGVWLMVGPLADLRTAMVIVRGERTEIPAETLLLRTLETFNDKEAIEQRREYDNADDVLDPEWDERYLDNVFTARFANVKFNDLSLSRAEVLGEYDRDMLDFAYSYFIGALPDPVIKFFGFDVNKEFVYSISTGDFIYLTSGGQGPSEVYRVGHYAGVGMATFGWWYLAILGVGIIAIFYLFDKFQYQRTSLDETGAPSNQQLKFSFCGLLAIVQVFQFLQLESVTMIGIFLLRGWLQLAFLYLVIFHVTRLLSGAGFRKLRWNTAAS